MNWNPTYVIYYGKILVVFDYYHTWPYLMKQIIFKNSKYYKTFMDHITKVYIYFRKNLFSLCEIWELLVGGIYHSAKKWKYFFLKIWQYHFELYMISIKEIPNNCFTFLG
jgi:hypothetical protein